MSVALKYCMPDKSGHEVPWVGRNGHHRLYITLFHFLSVYCRDSGLREYNAKLPKQETYNYVLDQIKYLLYRLG